jgi:hypothetical protein
MTLTILGIIGSILGIILYLLKSKPSVKQEKIYKLYDEERDTWENMRKLRDDGKHAEADEMLERIQIHAANGWSNSPDRMRDK